MEPFRGTEKRGPEKVESFGGGTDERGPEKVESFEGAAGRGPENVGVLPASGAGTLETDGSVG